MDDHGWTQAELARKSGLSPAVISRILSDDRDRLVQIPDDATVDGLARAFGGPNIKNRLWLSIARAMRIPVDDEVVVADATALSDDDLLRELGRRLAKSVSGTRNVTQLPRPTRSKSTGYRQAADKTRPRTQHGEDTPPGGSEEPET
jgi:transcriptional regulator with XRE-family HTH domain